MSDIATQYQMKSDKQHVLDKPGMYVGSIQNTDASMWCFDEETGKIVLKNIEYLAALYKLFDEAIVNCRDHVIRMLGQDSSQNVTYIEITISDDGTLTFQNDGDGVDVVKHPEYNIWIPELIFGHLRTFMPRFPFFKQYDAMDCGPSCLRMIAAY